MRYNDRAARQDGHWLRNLGLLLIGSAVIGAGIGIVGALRTGDRFLATLNHLLNPPQPTPKVNVQSIVLQQVREASELTTAVFTMQAVVPTSQDAAIAGFVMGTTKLLYVAHGEVQAGVDLSQLKDANVQVQGETVRVQLPPPRLLNSKIDVNRSSVYDYNRGWLGLGPDVAPTLQTEAQQKALKTIVAAACSDGLLQRANDRAKLVVSQFLKTAGYQTVTVNSSPPVADTCPATASASPSPSASPQP